MGDFVKNVEGWFTRPFVAQMSPLTFVALIVLAIVAVVWTHDGIRIIDKAGRAMS